MSINTLNTEHPIVRAIPLATIKPINNRNKIIYVDFSVNDQC